MLFPWLRRILLAGFVLMAVGGAVHAYHAFAEADATLLDLNHSTPLVLRARHGDTVTAHLQVLDATGRTTPWPGTGQQVPTYSVTDGTSTAQWGFHPDSPRPEYGEWVVVTLKWLPEEGRYDESPAVAGVQPWWYQGLYGTGAALALLAGSVALAAVTFDFRGIATAIARQLQGEPPEPPQRDAAEPLLKRIRP